MIAERMRRVSGTGGGSVSKENGRLGIPSMSSRTYAVNRGSESKS
jgi:hypothetical protein